MDISSKWAAACDLRGDHLRHPSILHHRLHLHRHRLHRRVRGADNNSTGNSGERTSAGLRAPLGL